MAASKRERILAEITARPQAIAANDGFNTDAGRTCFVGETPTLGEHDPDEAVAVLVGVESVTWQQAKLFITLPFQVIALAKVKTENGEVWRRVEAVVADIKRAMELEDRTLSGLLDQTKPIMRGPVVVHPRQAGSTTVGASVNYSLGFTETWGAP